MASRRPQGGAPQANSGSMPSGGGRSNEYFVPRDGIDREVITADICRYLGNDALVRPGHYENPQTGQVSQGYYITAYRNLTTPMIDDLKADSARWEAERRQQAARNAPAGYRDSATHNARQHFGPTTNDAGAAYSDSRDPYDGSRYPGSIAPGYSGNSSNGYAAAGQGQFASRDGYSSYPPQSGPSYSPQPDPRDRYPAPQQAQGYVGSMEPPYTATVTHSASRYPNDPRGPVPPSSVAPPQGSTYSQPPTGYAPSTGFYPSSNQNPAYAPPQPAQADPFGRAGATQVFSSSTPGQQYESTPAPRNPAPSSSNTQMPSSGSSHARRDRESSERHPADRHRPSRR